MSYFAWRLLKPYFTVWKQMHSGLAFQASSLKICREFIDSIQVGKAKLLNSLKKYVAELQDAGGN